MMRGLDGEAIFIDDFDRGDFVGRLASLLPSSGMRCFVWVQMPNHVHLVVQTGEVPLSRVMKRLNTGYALRFNRRHERRGYLFQNRFKSRPVFDDADLQGLVRYVLLNPLRAGLVANLPQLAHYPWSSYGALKGERRALSFEEVDSVLSLFAPQPHAAQGRLEAWLADGLHDSDNAGGTSELGVALSALIDHVCRRFDVDRARLTGTGKERLLCRARAAVAYLAVSEIGLPAALVAETFGVSGSAVSRAVARGREIASAAGLARA